MATLTIEANDQARFTELMQETYKKVYNMAFRLAGNRTDAEDLTQEAFVRAYRKFSDYQGDRPFENWIFRIVTRLFLDLLRNRRRRVQAMSLDAPLGFDGVDENLRLDVADDKPNPEMTLLESNLSEDLQIVMESLNEEQRLLVTLADVEELPYKEIAEIMDKPVGTIRSRLHRTHKLMRQRLEKTRRKCAMPCGCSALCASC